MYFACAMKISHVIYFYLSFLIHSLTVSTQWYLSISCQHMDTLFDGCLRFKSTIHDYQLYFLVKPQAVRNFVSQPAALTVLLFYPLDV